VQRRRGLRRNKNHLPLNKNIFLFPAGTGLPGASVHLKGTTHEVVTDKDGSFRFLTGQHLPVVIIVSYVGYQRKEVTETKNRNIDIPLTATASQLNDVVVVGYGTHFHPGRQL
jgi:hypothetical protein